LGRKLPLAEEVGPVQSNRFVAIFYFLWHNQQGGKSPNWDGPYDIGRILATDPAALSKPDSPLWGPIGMYHYWGEPLYGYYLNTDPWVLRRHAQLLADAGIDTLIFDTTNAQTYPEVYSALCAVFRKIREEGGRTPQLAFMVNTEAGKTAQRLYDDFYRPGLYPELWFQWQGKPLLICDPAAASPDLRRFFTLRAAHWPFTLTNTPYAWHWEATFPQPYGYTDDPQQPEQVNVSVAQNLRARDGKVTNMSAGDARGRSFHDGREDGAVGAVNYGYNFQEQWQRAFELKPPLVMVTGWNEWIAGRFGQPGGPLVFVDQFDEEFSRDIEPVKDAHADNYYWQMIANIRRFKGASAVPHPSAPKSIDLDTGFDQWGDVVPEFHDHIGETAPRDFDGSAGVHYVNRSGRNDLVACKVARDERNLYFYVRTREPITSRQGSNWMWLLLDIDQNPTTGWAGYDFIVNRTIDTDGKACLEKNLRGWQWQRVAAVEFRCAGNQLHLAVPRAALGLAADAQAVSLDFKWADHLQHPGDIMDFYVSGDVAPEGRFNFRYDAREAPTHATAPVGAAATGSSGVEAILPASTLRRYVEQFNRADTELYAQAIPNSDAAVWMQANVPRFECPDKGIELTYYFRWWTFRKHIRQTPAGFVITEFLPNVPWAGKFNTIACAAGHHFYEGRWLADPPYLDEYARFWFSPQAEPRRYSCWLADDLLARDLVNPNPRLMAELLPGMVANYEAWEKEHRDANGLFWQIDDRDGMEVSVGGSGYRATLNSYMFADARAIAEIARRAGRPELAERFERDAGRIKSLVQERFWDDQAQFFKVLPRGTNTSWVSVRELHGFTPWYFNLPDARFAVAWKQLPDPRGFFAPFGPTTTEQRCPGFQVAYAGHECQWNGPSWPYSSSVTLTALANLLNGPDQDVIGREEYFTVLRNYALSHRLRRDDGTVVPWIDENLNPFTGDWIARTLLRQRGEAIRERGKDYNHSTFCDLVISGLVGLRARPDDVVEVNPLAPADWEFFCLDHVRYHGRWLTILWDRTGTHYGQGQGLRILVDGKEVGAADQLRRLISPLP
jgi:hypothetical protein